MTDLMETLASWPTWLAALLAFGFAPGFVLRLLVRVYPRDHPRRKELLAELYVLGWIERPLFVVQQLETVLFEGVPHRFKALRKPRTGGTQPSAQVTVVRPGDPWWSWALEWDRLGEPVQAERILLQGIKAGHSCLWSDLVWIPANYGDHERVERWVRLATEAGHQIPAEDLLRVRELTLRQANTTG